MFLFSQTTNFSNYCDIDLLFDYVFFYFYFLKLDFLNKSCFFCLILEKPTRLNLILCFVLSYHLLF